MIQACAFWEPVTLNLSPRDVGSGRNTKPQQGHWECWQIGGMPTWKPFEWPHPNAVYFKAEPIYRGVPFKQVRFKYKKDGLWLLLPWAWEPVLPANQCFSFEELYGCTERLTQYWVVYSLHVLNKGLAPAWLLRIWHLGMFCQMSGLLFTWSPWATWNSLLTMWLMGDLGHEVLAWPLERARNHMQK